ncbi:TetR/AcrR family transcriptional regulator [Sphingomonas sp. 22176]|uniref:TetR/AcrR family transcriptional regulator n=1 Tax=Sphingomonas sp. 22176 TaxID=3453884 RepID=UPI003F82C174
MMSDTRLAILKAARSAVQARGYNALSFREVGKEIGVKSASIHYHFPTKGDLGAELARDYTAQGKAYLDELSACDSAVGCFDGYLAIFRKALEDDNRMCLCGIMAAEQHDLPEQVRVEVSRFTDMNVAWLESRLESLLPELRADARHDRAIAIFAAIEGAQLVARGRSDATMYDRAIQSYRASGLIPG